MKLERGKKQHTLYCIRNVRNRLAWFKTGIWKLSRIQQVLRKENAPYVERREIYTFSIKMHENEEMKGEICKQPMVQY
jgi:hypothetical protein